VAYTKDLRNVVVAKQKSPGGKITLEQLTLNRFQMAPAPQGAFRNLISCGAGGDYANRQIRTRYHSKLAPEGMGAGLSAVIPEGYRAMTERWTTSVGVSGFIMPGSFVDVVAVIVPAASQSGVNQDPISKIVLQNHKGTGKWGED